MTISKEKHLNFLVGLDELGRHSGNHGKWLHILRHHRTACRREGSVPSLARLYSDSRAGVSLQPGGCKLVSGRL
ncbi:hypothetical protein [Bacteroides timonensis]|uniref:hypothetical protein n=1 Tax=Bacteroides timonensis TaxID=1470345 RepID=UPI001427DE4F|nr:hypothetical protein [Bacteroides timonensis]